MRCFTWTFADRKNKTLGYGRTGYLLCPDNKYIKEPCYKGTGIFGGKDVYELVVDWNRHLLKKIYSRIPITCEMDEKELQVALAAMESDSAAAAKAQELFAEGPEIYRDEWKRSIGITISFLFERKVNLTGFKPIKVVSGKSKHIKYNQLPYSKVAQ